MEDNLNLLGAEGLIRKIEFVRIIIQCLYSLGYSKSAYCLEIESGIRCKSAEFELLESQILNGSWDDCISTLNSLEDLTDGTRGSALFLVYKQYIMEFLKQGNDSLALDILRKEISTSGLDRGKVQKLASSILSLKEIKLCSMNDRTPEPQKNLLMELENLLPPPYVLPERRLENLLEAAVTSQIDRCVYHNSSDAVSLYEDHCCNGDQLPTETIQILTEHKNEVWFVQFSHDGEYLASSSSDCLAIIWKVASRSYTGELTVLEDGKVTLKHILQSHKNPVSFVTWSPDDTKLLTCGNAEVVKLWDVETGTCKRTFGDHDFIVSSCAWLPDSKRLVCGSSHSEKGICMWDCDGNEIKAWRGTRMPKILDLAVTPDGVNLISVFSDKDIRILNLVTNAERVISEEHPITSLSISGDGKFFIVNLNSQEIHMWDVAGKFEKASRFIGHKQHKYVIRSCFGGLNSRFIASGSENAQVYIWNRQSPQPIEILSGHKMTVNSVSWNPRRPQMLASASDDQTIRVWAPSGSKTTPPPRPAA